MRVLIFGFLVLHKVFTAVTQEAAQSDRVTSTKTLQTAVSDSTQQTEPPPSAAVSPDISPAALRDPKIYHIGDGVTAPTPIPPASSGEVNPSNSKSPGQGRKIRKSGTVLVGFIVDEDGIPRGVQVIRGVDVELDQKALEATRLYRFKPATKKGRPVKVSIILAVKFDLF